MPSLQRNNFLTIRLRDRVLCKGKSSKAFRQGYLEYALVFCFVIKMNADSYFQDTN